MLIIKIPSIEFFNEETNEFYLTEEFELKMEHSLLSISKWESKWETPFIGKNDLTPEQYIDYFKCMVVNTEDIDDLFFEYILRSYANTINDYISKSHTATTFSKDGGSKSREIITSEVIYYCMIAYGIPIECQEWNLNRLLTLIKICKVKNEPQKKMSKNEILSRNARLNAYRRKKLGTKG